ncbi:MAG: nucleotide exchange factor GrpE [Deltaproteobacteria bacterium]|nr:nucleotide exchange factor GrpE [Deltaproteobacteria bacterium]
MTEQAAPGPDETAAKDAEGSTPAVADETAAKGGDEATAGAAEAPTAEAEVPIEEDESPAGTDETAARVAALEAEKEEFGRRIAELKDRVLRGAADFDNYRKRVARQEQETRERARAEALRTFLPVVDNVERALGFAEQMTGGEQIAQGLQMVLRGFFDAFGPDGLTRVEAMGKPFDPTVHEAVGQLETAETPAGCVAQELQSGYRLKERLLRPALVVVARPPAAAAAAGPPAPETNDQPGPSNDGSPGGT